MNGPGKTWLLVVALLLAAAVAYLSDPVLSDPQRGPGPTRTPNAVETPADTSASSTPPVSATSTPPTATTTPAVNSPPTVDVMTFRGTPFPDDKTFKVNISGSRVSIRLRGLDDDGNLDHLAVVDEDDEEQGRADCGAAMGGECTLEVTIPSPAEYDRAFTYHGIAVDSEGAVSEKSIPIEVTSVWDKGSYTTSSSPRPPTPKPPRPRPPRPPSTSDSMAVTAGEAAVFEHDSGAKIEIPEGATVPISSDWVAGPELTGVTQTTSDEMVTISITEFDTPVPNVLDVDPAFDVSIMDQDGEDVVLQDSVTVTLPFTMPEGKNAADVLVVHWNEPLERWESVDGGVVDETEQTVTVEMDHLSGIGVTFFVGPLQLLALTTASAVESGTLYSTYGEGFKRALTLHGEVNVPIFYGLGFEGGASLILDVDDILSLGDTKRKYTGEGTGGFFTYGLNGHLAGSFGDVGTSGSLQMTKSFTGKRGASRYNNDLSFDASISLLSVSVPGGFLDAEFLTFNENGNFNPVDVQINLCPECNYKLDFQAGHGAVIKVLDSTVNIAEGEFNTNFEDVLRDLAENRCGQSRCQMSWSELIEQFLRFMVSGMVGLYSLGEKVGLLYDYTDYEHISPADAADIGYGYINNIEGFGGGHDVNGDGVGDMVFPSDQTGGVPLRILTTGDRSEQKRHFLEVTEITDGWGIEFDPSGTPSDLNAASSTPSEGALVRVDFDAPALSLNEVHWLVTTTEDAPDAGQITLRLVNNRTGLADVQLDLADTTLWKDKQLSDLSIELEVDPDPARTDEPVTYTVTVQNKGPDRADDVKLTMKSISSLGLSLQQADLSGSSLSCGRPDSIGDLVCNLGNIDSEQTATATLEFALKPTFPTGTPFTTAFAVTQRQGGSPLPREELVPSDNSTSVTALTTSDRNALIALYNATGGQNWRNNANWLSEEPLDAWEGVTTDDRGRVIQLHLVEQRLNGQLPYEIGDLSRLKWLNIARNPNLTGDIPPEMAQLTELEVLYLWENDLTGPVPTWMGDLSELQQLSLGHNRLSGPIPLELGRLTKLDTLYLAGNDLTGGIPYSLSDLPSLTRLFLYDNNLGGSIPSVLGNLEMLEYLHLRGNSITGCVPLGLINVLDSDIDQLGLTDCEASGRRNSAKELVLTPSIDIPGGLWSDGTTLWVSDWVDDRIYAYDLATRQRDSTKDFDTLEAAGNTGPQGIWSDGTTMWVADDGDDKLYAYSLATKARDSAKDFDSLVAAGYTIPRGNTSPRGIWSDGATMWVADDGDDKLYAYNLATKARDSAKDFDTLVAAGNSRPRGIWSDGTTMWVVNNNSLYPTIVRKIFAYDLATRQRDSTKDFDTLDAAGNTDPQGIWSDGTTMWVADRVDDRIYAYDLATRQRDSTKDFDTLEAAGNTDPQGIWSDGTTMWVADDGDRKIYAYSLATGGRDTSKDIDSLVAAGNTSPRGIWSDGTTMWVANYLDKLYAYDMATRERDSSKDLDIQDRATGLWSDGTTMWVANDHDETISAYSLTTGNRVAYREFDTLIFDTLIIGGVISIYSRQRGIWSDGLTMWVTHSGTGKIYAYNMTSGKRDTSKDFDSLEAVGNNSPVGIWSDGTTMWVADPSDEKIYAYNLATEGLPVCGTTTCVPFGWNPEKDFNLIPSLDSSDGIWANETTMWVSDREDDKIYAYNISTGRRDAAKDFNSLIDSGNFNSGGIWSDGTTMWVADRGHNKLYAYNLTTKQRDTTKDFDSLVNVDDISHYFSPYDIWSDGTTMWVNEGVILAYNLATRQRDTTKDFDTQTLVDAGNTDPTSIWSDGTTMWVLDIVDSKIYAYNLSTRQRDASKDFDTIPEDDPTPYSIWSDGTTLWVANQLIFGAYNLATKEREEDKDLDIVVDTDPDAPYYIWTNGTTMWVADPIDDKLYAYVLATRVRDVAKDIDLSLIGQGAGANGIWSDDNTMWVVAPRDSIYAYDLDTGERDDTKDFDLTGVADGLPRGIWSDGTTMWVADGALYAYNLSTRQRDSAKDFNTLRDARNASPRGIWSDGTTMWVANLTLGHMKIFAYDMVTKQWDSTKDFNTLDIYGNSRPQGITSDGTTMWVTQFDDHKIYAYNMPP